jgi:gluconolactonase
MARSNTNSAIIIFTSPTRPTRMGIQVCDQAGRVNCIIPTPNGRIANLCFGGADFQTLFATCGDRVYKRKVKVKGANAYEAPVKSRAPRQ